VVQCEVATGIPQSTPFVIDRYNLLPNNKLSVSGLALSDGRKRITYAEEFCKKVERV
jgi:hypothetical protein